MKNITTLLAVILISIAAMGQNKSPKQVKFNPDGNLKALSEDWAPVVDFTADDIDGVEHNLQSYLDAGKYVIVDKSATWCGPCYSLHQTGVFEDLWNNYGPDGTDELMVFWIESDPDTGIDDIEGNTTESAGDFTNDGAFPVPIINSTSAAGSFNELSTGYIPEVYLLCPSGYYKIITDEAWTSATAVYNSIGDCPSDDTDVEMANVSISSTGTDCALGTESITVDVFNFSLQPVSDIEVSYTVNAGTPVTATIAGPVGPMTTEPFTFSETVDMSAGGAYDVVASLSHPDDVNAANNTNTAVAISGDAVINIDIVFDNYPSETSWELQDQDLDIVIASGDDYDGQSSLNEDVCVLSSHCYTFTIYDSYGDGICCAYGNGSYTISYNGTEVGSGGDFDSEESITDICSVGIEADNESAFSMHPNPTSGMVTIENAENARIRIYNILGQSVYENERAEKHTQVQLNDFPAGTYFVQVSKGYQTQTEKLILNK